MSRKNKYKNFPTHRNIRVGEHCLICECNRQVRNEARSFIQEKEQTNALGFPAMFPKISPGMEFTGLNSETGETETFEVVSVPIFQPQNAVVERIK